MYQFISIPNEVLIRFDFLIKQQLNLAIKNIRLYREILNDTLAPGPSGDLPSLTIKEMDKYIDDCKQYLMTPQKVQLLLGEADGGKSLFCQYLLYHLLHSSPNINFIPIYIDLNNFNNVKVPFVESFLQENYQLSDNHLEELKKQNVLFIFDHYGRKDHRVNLYMTQQLEQWNAKCIIVTEKNILKSFKDHRPCFIPYQQNKKQLALYSEIQLPMFLMNSTKKIKASNSVSNDRSAKTEGQNNERDNIYNNKWRTQYSVQKHAAENQYQLEELLNHPLNQLLIVDDLNVIKLLVDKIKVDACFVSFLFKLIYGSRHEPRLAIAAANAITALNYAHVSFSGLDFSYINIPFADLRGAMFHGTNLSYANLQGAKLQNIFLYDANLESCNLTNADFEQQPHLLYQGLVVTSVSYSENKKWLAAGGTDNCVCVWQKLDDGYSKPLALKGHTDWAESVVFSSDNRYLISGSRDKSIIVWQTTHFEQFLTLTGHTDWIRCVAVSNNNELITSASRDKTVKLWSLPQGKLINTFEGHTDWVNSVAISISNEFIASAGRDKNVCVWNIKDGSLLYMLKGHTKWINSVVFSKDNSWVASAGDDLSVHIWHMNSGKLFTKYSGHQNAITQMAISSNNLFLAIATDYTVWLWSVEDNLLKRIFYGQVLSGTLLGVKSVTFSPDNQWIIAGFSDSTVRFWQLKTELHHSINQNIRINDLECLAFNSTNQFIAVGGWDGTIRIWHIKSGKLLKTLEGHKSRVISLQFENDNILSIDHEKNILTRSCVDGSIQNKFTFPEPQSIYGVANSADNQYFATISKDKQQVIMLWRKENNNYLLHHTLEKHKGWIICIAISRDKKWLASGGVDKFLKIWRINDGILQYDLTEDNDYINCIAFSTDSQLIASGNFTNKICIYSLLTGKLYRTLQIESDEKFIKGNHWITCLAFSEDNQWLAAGNSSGHLKIWRVIDGELQHSIDLFSGITKLAFNFENSNLAVTCIDCALKIFDFHVSNNKFLLLFKWLSHKRLTLFNASFKNAQGISAIDEQLLDQHGAIHIPKKQKSMPRPAFFQNKPCEEINLHHIKNPDKIKRMLRWVYYFEPEPGLRISKFDGTFWYGEVVTGRSDKSQIINENESIEVKIDDSYTHKNKGTLIKTMNTIDFQMFIPHAGSREMYLWFRHNQKGWGFCNSAEEMDVSSNEEVERNYKKPDQ